MPDINLLLTNLFQPIILAFVLGAIAGFVKNELELPDAAVKVLAIYLLFSLGLQGGHGLARADLGDVAPLVAVTALMIFAIPTAAYFVTRRLGGFDISNAAAIAAHYGSVSSATFMAAMAFAAAMDTPAMDVMPAMVALMEFGVIYSLLIARLAMGRREPGDRVTRVKNVFLSVIRGRGILLIMGGMAIGAIATERQFERIEPFYDDLFRGALMLFLLDMGMVAARQIRAFKEVGLFMGGFAIVMPLINGLIGVTLAHIAGLDVGTSFVFGAICASASFIDAPAACRAALPEANPGIYLTSSVGVTLPFNLLLGLPIFYKYAQFLAP